MDPGSTQDNVDRNRNVLYTGKPVSEERAAINGETTAKVVSRPANVRNTASERIRLNKVYNAVVEDIKWANAMDILQAAIGVVSTILFIYSTYPGEEHAYGIEVTQLVFTSIYLFDFLFNIVYFGLSYITTLWALVDLLTALPFWWNLYNLNIINESNSPSAFINFIVKGTGVWQWLTLARFLRVYKPLRIAELRRLTFWSDNALTRGLWTLIAIVSVIVLLGAGLFFLVETSQSHGTPMLFHDAIYFLVVTISTVGYGDVTPSTAAGRMTVILIIFIAIILIPIATSDFVSSMTEYNKYGHPYQSSRPHIILCPQNDVSWNELSIILTEFFHSSKHSDVSYHVVILCNAGEEHRNNVMFHCKSLPFWSDISYIVGSASSVEDLTKASVNTAQAIFLTTSIRQNDPAAESAQDKATLTRALSIKHLVPEVPIILHLLSPKNKKHILWYQLSQFSNIKVLCLNEIKQKIFATTCLAPGALGLVSNLLSSYDGKQSLRSIFSESAARPTSSQLYSLHNLDDEADSPNQHTQPPLTIVDMTRASSVKSGLVRPWQEEYLYGFGHEMYTAELPQYLNGLSFIEAAAVLFEISQVVLIALYRKDERSGRVQVMLNPGNAVLLKCTGDVHNDIGCMIARSAEHARSITIIGEQVQQLQRTWRSRTTQHIRSAPIGRTDDTMNVVSSSIQRTVRTPLVDVSGDTVVVTVKRLDDGADLNAVTFRSHGVDVDSATNDSSLSGDRAAQTSSGQAPTHPTAAAAPDLRPHQMAMSAAPYSPVHHGGGGGKSLTPSDDLDPFSHHVVLCGFIDHRIVHFLRRFRESDARTVVLVIDAALATSLSASVFEFIKASYRDIHVIFAGAENKRGETADRDYLNYTDPCFGHGNHQLTDDSLLETSLPEDETMRSQMSPALLSACKSNPLLANSNWFRQACVHRADTVLILATPYASAVSSSQATSELSTSDGNVNDDEVIEADSFALMMYTSLVAFLDQCILSKCPTLKHAGFSKHVVSIVAVELIHDRNLRLLKSEIGSTLMFQPTPQQELGWRPLILKSKELVRQTARPSASKQDSLDSIESPIPQHQVEPYAAHFKAFYTSDGLVLSAKILDILLVQSFHAPQIFDTVDLVCSGYNHILTSEQRSRCDAESRQLDAVSSDRAFYLRTPQRRQFRVELILLDCPTSFVGWTYGNVVLKLMMEKGWICMGVYRDRRQVDRDVAAKKKANKSATEYGTFKAATDDDESDAESESRTFGSDYGDAFSVGRSHFSGSIRRRSAFYVLTNPRSTSYCTSATGYTFSFSDGISISPYRIKRSRDLSKCKSTTLLPRIRRRSHKRMKRKSKRILTNPTEQDRIVVSGSTLVSCKMCAAHHSRHH